MGMRIGSSAQELTYVYGVLEGEQPSLGQAPQGLPETSPLRALKLAPRRWLIVASAPEERYGEVGVAAALKDLDFISDCALRHENVVEELLEHGTLVPMKLFTLFTDDERALAAMRQQSDALAAALDRVAGCREFGLRVILRARPGHPALLEDEEPEVAGKGKGAAFLLAKKRRRDVAVRVREIAEERARTAFHRFASLSREAVQRDDLEEGKVLFDAVLLVEDAREQELHVLVEREAAQLKDAGALLEMTGPWPAYHFISDRP